LNFLEYAYRYIDSKEKNSELKTNYRARIRRIEKTQLIHRFIDVNRKNMIALNEYFVNEGYSTNYIKGLFFALNDVIKSAMREGYLYKNPIAGYKIQKGKDGRAMPPLPGKYLKQIENMKFKTSSIQFAADLFIFSCHTGMAYTDVISTTYKDIHIYEKKNWIVGKRNKSKVEYLIPIDDTVMKIIDKYKKKQNMYYHKISEDHIFPYMRRQTYYTILQKTGKIIGLADMKLSPHKGRHTFATQMLLNNVSIESIKKMLGHSAKSNVTWLYAEINREKIGKEVFRDT
jgi:integrase